jgi:plasmid stability protein
MDKFQPIRSYDIPEVMLTQMIDGELSLSSAWDTFSEGMGGDPVSSMAQRDSVTQRLIDKHGGNPFSDAAIGVLTNPLTYLMFLTSPAGAQAGKSLFATAPRLSAWAMENLPLLHHLKAATGNHAFRGTGIPAALEQFQRSTEKWLMESRNILRQPAKDFFTRHKVRGNISIKRFAGNDVDAMERMSTLAYLKMSRGFEDTVELIPEVVYEGPEGILKGGLKEAKKLHNKGVPTISKVEHRAVTHKRLVNMTEAELDAEIARIGGTELMQGMIDQREYAFKKLFYTEAGDLDLRKLQRMYNSTRMNKGAFSQSSVHGDQVIQQLFGPDMTKMIRDGEIDFSAFENMVKGSLGTSLAANSSAYMPRNYFQFFDSQGNLLSRNSTAVDSVAQHNKGLLSVTGNVKGRNKERLIYDPQSLARVEAVVGSNRMNRQLVADNESNFLKAIQESKKGEIVAVTDIDGFESMARYDNQARRTYSLFTEEVDARTMDGWNRVVDQINTDPAIASKIAQRDVRFRNGKQGFSKLDAVDAPEGGYTVADLLDVSDGLLGNGEKRSQLRTIFIPRLTGEATSANMIAGLTSSAARTTADAFMNTDLGKNLLQQKGFVGQMAKKIEDFASSSPIPNAGLDRDLASYFYTTHLGLNMGSVVANLTQPIITTARWVGFRDLAPAYAESLVQYGKFAAEIARTPKRYLTDPEFRTGLIHRFFPLADESSLLKDSIDEMLDFDLRRTGVLEGMSGANIRQVTRDAFLFPFQQGEIFNRVVTANAIARRSRRLGMTDGVGRLTGEALDDVARGVQETQFGTDLLNTPLFLLDDKNPLSNPLLKQFLQFPLRMLIAPFEVGSQLKGNANTMLGIGVDFARGIGISAVGYELVKGLTGSDVSDLGFIESTMQLGSSAIDDEDGPLPIPPVIDIPVDIARGLAEGDEALIARSYARMVPGGVAAQRLINVLPQFSTKPVTFVNYQNRYADWNSPNEAGQIPIYDRDNRLISFENPETLLAQAVGLDRQGFQDEAELTRFLMKQSEAEREARSQLINAVFTNNTRKAEKVRAEFEKKHGYRLTVSKSQMQAATRLRQQTRAERVLDRTPQDIRSQMARLVANTDPNLGVPREEFVAASRASERDPHRLFSATDSLDPQTRAYIARLLEGAQNGPADRTFPQ